MEIAIFISLLGIAFGIIMLSLQLKRARQAQPIGEFLRSYADIQEKLLLAEHELQPSKQKSLQLHGYRALFALHFAAFVLRQKRNFEEQIYSQWLQQRRQDFAQNPAYQEAWNQLKKEFAPEFQAHLDTAHTSELEDALYRRNWEDALDESVSEISKKGLTESLIDGMSLNKAPK